MLIDEARRWCDAENVDYLEIRSNRPLAGDLVCSTHKVSVTLELSDDPDVLWKGFKTGHRQEIRRGYKRGLEARHGGLELLDDFFDVMSESFRNLGTPLYSRHYFRTILEAFPESTRLCVLYGDGEPAAAAFDGMHRDTVEGMWLGSKAKFRSWLVGYVLYWELIKDACERGYRRFHLGRSTVESGGEAFKKKWNADSLQLYWYYYLRHRKDLPGLNVQNPRYQKAIGVWRQLPVGLTQFIGPSIARNIP
jgi:FemAB-related protein (PEP-CTERM system-associated)